MHRRRRSSRDSVPLLLVLLVGLTASAVLILALAVTIGGIARERAPALAARFGGGDARSLANVARSMVEAGEGAGALQQAEQLTRLAVQRDATVPEAYGVLGEIAEARGQTVRADRAFSHAVALSKRELETELWLARRALSKGDGESALLHLDRALKVHARSRPIILPLLVSALDDPMFIEPIVDRMEEKPVWGPDYLAMAASQARSPANLSIVLDRLSDRGVSTAPEIVSKFAVRLARENSFDLAARQYERSTGAAPGQAIHNGDFEKAGSIQPFDWDFSYQPDYSAEPSGAPEGGEGRALRFRFGPDASAILLRQLLMLRPGRYEVTGRIYLEKLDRVTVPEWRVVCADGDEPLVKVAIRPPLARWVAFRQAFEVPQNCGAQWLQLARPAAVVEGEGIGYFDDLAVRRSRAASGG